MIILFSTNDETYTCTCISQTNLNLQQGKVRSRETEKPTGVTSLEKKNSTGSLVTRTSLNVSFKGYRFRRSSRDGRNLMPAVNLRGSGMSHTRVTRYEIGKIWPDWTVARWCLKMLGCDTGKGRSRMWETWSGIRSGKWVSISSVCSVVYSPSFFE